MTETTARQPKGIPTGGQFAATAHAEPDVTILPPDGKGLTQFLMERDEIRGRRERLQDQADEMDAIAQIYSVRTLAAAITRKFPTAATLRIGENVDGENIYDPLTIRDAQGTILADAADDDMWVLDELTEDGLTIQDLVWDLDVRSDRWAQGIATIEPGRRKHGEKHADIDLKAALTAPIPSASLQSHPHTRSFTEEEQEDLVNVAGYGLTALENSIDAADEQDQRDRLEGLLERATALLTFPKSE